MSEYHSAKVDDIKNQIPVRKRGPSCVLRIVLMPEEKDKPFMQARLMYYHALGLQHSFSAVEQQTLFRLCGSYRNVYCHGSLGEIFHVMGLARLLWHVEGLQVLDRCRSFAAQPTAPLINWVPATATATATATKQGLIKPYKAL